MPAVVYIGLGGNLGPQPQLLLDARADLGDISGYVELALSGCWRSAPRGPIQDQPDFYNAVIKAAYLGTAFELLSHFQRIELKHGRCRHIPGGPRSLDLDLLLFGQESINEPDLLVPHPRLTERAFVLRPLAQLDSALIMPGFAVSVEQLLKDLGDEQRIEEVAW